MTRRSPRHLEFQMQCAVIQWLAYEQKRHPELAYLYSVPSDIRTTPARAGRAKASGMKAGVPDLVLPVPRGGYFGFYIELKTEAGRVTPAQEDFLRFLRSVGYATGVYRSAPEARDKILAYLKLPVTPMPITGGTLDGLPRP